MCRIGKDDIGSSYPEEGIGVNELGLQRSEFLVFKDTYPRVPHATSLRTALSTPLIFYLPYSS
jgi:hypothetical protein